MAELVGGALLGTAVSVLYEILKQLIAKNQRYAIILEKPISRIDSLKPLIDKLMEDNSEQDLKGLLEVIEVGKALIGGYLVRGKDPKKKDAKIFDEWDADLKQQLDLLNLESVIESRSNARKAAVNTEEILPLVKDANTGIVLLKELNTEMLEMLNHLLLEKLKTQNQCAENEAYCAVPELPTLTVGLDGPLNELKRMMFDEGKSMIVVNAMGGSGKTTLAIKFCRDKEIQEKFNDNIFFVTVTEKFNLELIVQKLHQRKGSKVPPAFTDENDAVTWLHKFLRKEEHNPFLLVLDDVWSESQYLVGKFLCQEMKDTKILVTSRSQLLRFVSIDSQYKLEALNSQDAMELFNHSVNSSQYPELAKTIVDSCKGLPLALTVAGGSLSGQPRDIWIETSATGHPKIAPKDEVSYSLQKSLDVLDENMKGYFLDLVAFPNHRRISVGAIIDMWAELYDLSYDKEDALCYAKLISLKSRNLVNLVGTRKDKIDEDVYRKGDYVILHDLLKELALQNSEIHPEDQRSRLIVDIRRNCIPRWWRKDKCLQARLLCISTDSVFAKKLPNIRTEAEVLSLNFQSRKYILPEFVENMLELRVLLVKYDVPSDHSNAEVDGFKQLGSLPNLKRIRLEKLSIRSITESPFMMKSLLKMSLIQCDLSRASGGGDGYVKISVAFPYLEELTIERCYNCMEFLAVCCDLVYLTVLSIINCHDISLLPERIGNLVNLEVLRLRSCKDLLTLPDSVANLKRVDFLDISECSSIDISECSSIFEMSSLTKLDLRYCRDTDKLRQLVLNLKHLKEVICTCDRSTEKLWEAVKPVFGSIRIIVKNPDVFSSDLELANFFLTSDPVNQAWNAIEKQNEINPNAEPCLFNEIQPENPTIIAFGTPPSALSGQEEGLVSSSRLKQDNFDHFEFLCNRTNPDFSLNKAAVKLFQSHYDELLQLKIKLVKSSMNRFTPSPVIITGHSVGGAVATLFTLWLLQDFNRRARLPICVTFGSPLVGDENLRRCVLQFSSWKSCFLHVVSDQDPTPGIFLSLNPDLYKPFGTFLLCSASGCACFENLDIILKYLVKTNSRNPECHYGKVLAHLRCKTICYDSNSTEPDIDSLQATFITQLQAIGISASQETKSLISMNKHETSLSSMKQKFIDSYQVPNEMRIQMASLELFWHESRRAKTEGYYDRYRNQGNTGGIMVDECMEKLMNYWEEFVTEIENKPQTEGAPYQIRWLYGARIYSRMVEPLHIASYYKNGGESYKTNGNRPKHFILVEKWFKRVNRSGLVTSKSKRELVESSLNEDPCFWAEVEEARRSCIRVKNGSVDEKEQALQELKNFEAYVYASLESYALNPEMFFEKSSFMRWLQEYKEVVDNSDFSLLLDFMNKRSYEAYEKGMFIFP